MRWIVPVVVAALAAGLTVRLFTVATRPKPLPAITASQLIAAMHADVAVPYAGTLVAQVPSVFPVSSDLTSSHAPILLMAGAHTMRFWYGGPDQQRVALVTPTNETDVITSGSTVWQWDTANRVAQRSTVPVHSDLGAPFFPAPMTFAGLAPAQLAQRSTAAVDQNTRMHVTTGPSVADRPTYQLSLIPNGNVATRIRLVRIDVDAVRKVPLGVQVYARGSTVASISVAFSSVTFSRPSADNFTFSPPADATVDPGLQQLIATADPKGHAAVAHITTPQQGWAAVTSFRVPSVSSARLGPLRSDLFPVSGTWGKGYLFQTPLLCMLLTEDGDAFIGSVAPATLYAAAAA